LIALFRRLQKGDFELSCTLKSYLRIVCRNLWLTRLRDRSKVDLQGEEELAAVELDGSILEQIEQSEREQLFFKHFDGLGENCRKILQWFFDKMPLAKIAEKLDTSENYIKKRKFICKERLIKAIREDARFSELK
ncbi:MAG: sigma-70 family RNA polymerase sigma factor, partial [Bacteroidota bacterium]